MLQLRLGTGLVVGALTVSMLCVLGACSPQLKRFDVPIVNQGTPVTSRVVLEHNAASVQTPRLTVRRLAADIESSEEVTVADGLDMTQDPGNQARYSTDLGHLSPGSYRAFLNVPYRRLVLPGLEELQASEFFYVNARGCHSFDVGNQLYGWQLSSLFDGDTTMPAGGCPDLPSALAWNDAENFHAGPDNDARGSLRVFVGQCFYIGLRPGSGYWRVDFVSPGLTADTAWQTASGFGWRIKTDLANLKAQPLLRIRKPDGEEALWREEDAQGQPVFYDVGPDAWTRIFARVRPPEGATVLAAVVRVLGAADTPAAPGPGIPVGVIHIDTVCPE